jgi:tellurite resistance protein
MLASMSKQNATIAELEKHAESIRAELRVAKQGELFKNAVEAGYLTALADGVIEDAEIESLVRAVEILSVGGVIEWETSALVDECKKHVDKDGAAKRATAVGEALRSLGSAEAGILVAAVVARSAKKIDKKEADVLKAIGKAAGLSNDQVAAIVKRATSLLA